MKFRYSYKKKRCTDQFSSLMRYYDHATLPTPLTKDFKKSNLIHNYQSRMATQGELHTSKVSPVLLPAKS